MNLASLRHSRQSRLDGIGEVGQRLIRDGEVEVLGDGAAAGIMARYVAGAGVGAVVVASDEIADAARSIDGAVSIKIDARLRDLEPLESAPYLFYSASAKAVGDGAYRALRAVLRLASPSDALTVERSEEAPCMSNR